LNKFLSIIIPVYNSEASLKQCLESISNQIFTDYEIIFADGGSRDGTLQIISDFQAGNTRSAIKLLPGPDRGIYDAMNKAIAIAEGAWLYFMGSDDTLAAPDILEVIKAESEKSNADLIYGNVTGRSGNVRYVYNTKSSVLSTGIHHQSVFYRSCLFAKFGNYDLRFRIAADYHFTLKVFMHPELVTKYVDLDVAVYGESGFSSRNFDYTFYSYHYKLLAMNNCIDQVDDPEKCLEKSVYCCLLLAKEKINTQFAWKNLWYYLVKRNSLSLSLKIRTLGRMIMWNLKPLA